jgi:aspartate/glutamate racemase
MLVQQSDCALPLFDTTELHARSAVDWALAS